MAEKQIPLLDLAPEIDALWPELTAAIEGVLRTRQFILGPNVKAFEREVADFVGVRHAVGVNSGTDALVIGLKALEIEPGDEVITTPFSFVATAECIALVGATPVFVDIDPQTCNIDPGEVARAVTPRTKAIIPVHLYGQPAAMGAITAIAEQHDLVVLEDAAQAFGASYRGRKIASIGAAGALSFFPSKTLGAFGDAGMLVTDDDGVAERAEVLRKHGSKRKYYNEVLGYNSRLDELQAAVLRVKLPHLDEANRRRREAASRYGGLLADVEGIEAPREPDPEATHVFHQYTVRISGGRRDAVHRALGEARIASAIYYPVPLHHLQPYRSDAPLPHTEQASGEVLSLPIWPSMPEALQRRVVEVASQALD